MVIEKEWRTRRQEPQDQLFIGCYRGRLDELLLKRFFTFSFWSDVEPKSPWKALVCQLFQIV